MQWKNVVIWSSYLWNECVLNKMRTIGGLSARLSDLMME